VLPVELEFQHPATTIVEWQNSSFTEDNAVPDACIVIQRSAIPINHHAQQRSCCGELRNLIHDPLVYGFEDQVERLRALRGKNQPVVRKPVGPEMRD
jgi:hypothetical protein